VTERLDAIIDEVAATMTAGDPRADFDARVMARIAAPRPYRGLRTADLGWVLVPAAAIVIAFVVMRPHEDQSKGRLKPATTVATTPATATTAQQMPDAGGLKPATTKAAATTRVVATRAAATRAAAAPVPGALPPLVNSRIDVAPLTVDSLTSAPISLDRLDTIERIDVAPLTLDDSQRRDR
jgi:hypothetical protein